MDLIEVITENSNSLTESEARVADYALSNASCMAGMSVQEFSRNAGVSVATTVRCCQKLGFQGYRDFCLSLIQNHYSPEQLDYVINTESNANSMRDKVTRVLTANVETIRLAIKTLDYDALDKAADLISKARHVCFVGMGTSHIVCNDAMTRFMRIGIDAVCYSDPHSSVVAVTHYDSRDVVVAVSHSGITQEVYEVQKIAQQNGAKIIAITTYPDEIVGCSSDVVLRTNTRESPFHKIAITSRTSQLAMIDALFIAVTDKAPTETSDSMKRVSENVTGMMNTSQHKKER